MLLVAKSWFEQMNGLYQQNINIYGSWLDEQEAFIDSVRVKNAEDKPFSTDGRAPYRPI